MKITVLVVDDQHIVRQGLKCLVETSQELELLAEAASGEEAVRVAVRSRPNVVIMGLKKPNFDGIEAIRQLRAKAPDTKVVVLAADPSPFSGIAALRAGAAAFLGKSCVFSELLDAIRTVVAGGSYLGAGIAELLVGAKERSATPFLTNREQEIVRLLADGANVKEIAFLLGLSVKTVESHRLRIMKKLKVNGIAALTKYAIQEGLCRLW